MDKPRHFGDTRASIKAQAPHYQGGRNFLEKQAVWDTGIITAKGLGFLGICKRNLLTFESEPKNAVLEWHTLHKQGLCGDK